MGTLLASACLLHPPWTQEEHTHVIPCHSTNHTYSEHLSSSWTVSSVVRDHESLSSVFNGPAFPSTPETSVKITEEMNGSLRSQTNQGNLNLSSNTLCALEYKADPTGWETPVILGKGLEGSTRKDFHHSFPHQLHLALSPPSAASHSLSKPQFYHLKRMSIMIAAHRKGLLRNR